MYFVEESRALQSCYVSSFYTYIQRWLNRELEVVLFLFFICFFCITIIIYTKCRITIIIIIMYKNRKENGKKFKKIGNFEKKNMIFYGFLCISSTISPSIHSISPKNRFKFTQLLYKFLFFVIVLLLLLAAGAAPCSCILYINENDDEKI